MNIEALAREAGWIIHDDMPYQDVQMVQDALIARLEKFAHLIREAVTQELVAGSGEPFTARAAHDSVWDNYYTADQLAGAVAAERERCAVLVADLSDMRVPASEYAAAIRSGE